MNNYYYDPQAEAYRQAERRVKAKIGFYWHLASYIVVNGFLTTIYLVTSWANNGFYYPWVIWPILGWGIGLLFNFLGVFVFPDTPASRQKMIEKELNQMGTSNYTYLVPPPPPQNQAGYQPYQSQPLSTVTGNSTEPPVPVEPKS